MAFLPFTKIPNGGNEIWTDNTNASDILLNTFFPQEQLPQELNGSLTLSLQPTSILSDATTLVTASLSTTVGNVTISSVAGIITEADLNQNTNNVIASIDGTVLISGILQRTLENVTNGSSGQVLDTAILQRTIENISLSSTGQVSISGTASTNTNISISSTGQILIVGTTNKNIDSISCTSQILTEHPQLSLQLDEQLDNISISSSVSVGSTSGLNIQLNNVQLQSQGTVSINGILVQNIGTLISSSGTVAINSSLQTTLNNVDIDFTGTVNVDSELNSSISMSISSEGKVEITGKIESDLNNVSLNSKAAYLTNRVATVDINVNDVLIVSRIKDRKYKRQREYNNFENDPQKPNFISQVRKQPIRFSLSSFFRK